MAFVSPEWLRIALLAGLVNIHQYWRRLVNSVVPEPYLDEVFHVPQAQAYWAGKWSHWDDKITTPPALYGFSYVFNVVRHFGRRSEEFSVEDLRFVNVMLLCLLLVVLYLWTSVARKPVNAWHILQQEFNIVMFPLFFFFSGLYYTDVFSTLSVVSTYIAWTASVRWSRWKWAFQFLHLLFGFISLASRQTNIFWVAVFLGGLQVVETVKCCTGAGQIHDPNVAEVWFEDIPTTCISLLSSAIPNILQLTLDLWPQITLLGSFAAFIVWNGGVVLGDKSNHIATIHSPQLLYLWPFIVFFSWPILLPQLANLQQLKQRTPRWWIVLAATILMSLSVHYNTIVHPFTLADNRHYVFYIFRILTRYSWVKYAVVPVYAVCAWLAVNALGGATDNTKQDLATPIPASNIVTSPKQTKLTPSTSTTVYISDTQPPSGTVHLSFVLIWFASTALSLVSAPLVEPRYFMIPWLIWRMHVPEYNNELSSPFPSPSPNPPKHKNTTTKNQNPTTNHILTIIKSILPFLASYSLWIELTWYLIINLVTCYIFLYRGFTWPQEPGKIQRFMW